MTARHVIAVALALLIWLPAAGGGVRLGGTVVDERGRPLAGAAVWLDVRRDGEVVEVNTDSGNFEAGLPLRATAGDNGQFAFELPDGGAVLGVTAAAAGHPEAAGRRFLAGEVPDVAAFRDGTATLALPPGRVVAGTVTGPDGEPAAGGRGLHRRP